MKWFLDTEFIEGFHKPLFGKRRHFIDLISIGIVSERGDQYYAISSEYNYKDADEWVRENVILPMYLKSIQSVKTGPNISTFHKTIGMKNTEIVIEIMNLIRRSGEPPEFYGYYCDYDWVLFCSLFGRMIHLPKGYPMYCRDLKQMVDEKNITSSQLEKILPAPKGEHDALVDAKWNKQLYDILIKIN
jgi:hypothetical protein